MSNLSTPLKPVYKSDNFAYYKIHMPEISKEIIICAMADPDLEQVLEIERASFPHPWLEQHFRDEINSVNAFPLSAFDSEGRLAGYICPLQVVDEGHILNVAVDPLFRGKGVGRMLVQRVLDDCRMNGASFVSLEVRVSNSTAISLYSRLGFTVTGKRKQYYENGEDAIMMEYIFRPWNQSG